MGIGESDGIQTLNGDYIRQGYQVVAVIPDNRLPEGLPNLLTNFARGDYKDLQIVPGELALDGFDWALRESSHIIYAKFNIKHKKNIPYSLVAPEFAHISKKERKTIPLHTIA